MSDQQSQSFDYDNAAGLTNIEFFNAIADDPAYNLSASQERQILEEPAPTDPTLYTTGLPEEWNNIVDLGEPSHEQFTADEPLPSAHEPISNSSWLGVVLSTEQPLPSPDLDFGQEPVQSASLYAGNVPTWEEIMHREYGTDRDLVFPEQYGLPEATLLTLPTTHTQESYDPVHHRTPAPVSHQYRGDYVPVPSAQEPYPEEEAVSLFDIAAARDALALASQDRQIDQEPMQPAPPRPVEVGEFGEYVYPPTASILRSPQRQRRRFARASSSPPRFSEAPAARGRSRRSIASPSTSTLSPSAVCQMCVDRAKDKSKARQKKFKPTVYNNGVYCNKHTAQVEKERLANQPPFYTLDQAPDAASDAKTTDLVYPMVPPLDYDNPSEEDDYLDHVDNETPWVALLTAAANKPYVRPDEINDSQHSDAVADRNRRHDNAVKQQRIYNKKPLEASSRDFYNDVTLNSRLRMLFRAVLTYHQGGRCLYPVGGSNNGYGDDRTLSFTRRMWVIIEAMEVDKRVVMDVVEGRGVAALAANPRRFADRKNSNNKCNENKRKKLGYTDDSDGEDGADDGADDDDDDVEDGGQGPGPSTEASRKRRRT
ncbi:hypothetical protein LTR56_007610 [Elasticomyces elasticus]|nr:hypothetical protein LTR56_007610 [Elasticomyces elasticus]KAK3665311.1 hypothetical protein LTR22_003833 [Elasticomyces elasticus]KAK4929716.1 hypothetical protein LTR49_003674 [Elasticomyces elasticus]KAK5761064.1 hypothetical protein LTS12_008741 [Elasticomyces elasticus]